MTNPPSDTPAGSPRRTRLPDRLTDTILILTVIFGVWAVGLGILTTVGILRPAF